MPDVKYDVLGIGNAIVDVLSYCEDTFLQEHMMDKGCMTMVDASTADFLYKEMGPATECSGGSAANTLAAMAMLGSRTAFIGKVHDDDLGKIFTHDLRSVGVHFDPVPSTSGKPTARCLIFVTPDGQRTMNTFIGACNEVASSDIDEQLIKDSAYVYVEGYLWDLPEAKEAIRRAVEMADANDATMVFSLSDVFCVNRHGHEFRGLIKDHMDIVFANEAEVCALYEVKDIRQAAEKIRPHVKIAALTMGEKGSIIVTPKETIEIKATPVAKVMDTTGAGDLYAAGFLHGLAQGWELKRCGELASQCASEILCHLGARPQKPLKHLVA